MAAAAPIIELWNYCPYLACGERTNVGAAARFCGQCGAGFNVCSACLATNRLLAGFCRACGKGLDNEAWPMHPGLKAPRKMRATIGSLGEISAPFPLRLEGEVMVSPIAADGLLVVTHGQGSLTLLGEMSGQVLGSIFVNQAIAVTPALHAGTLFVAAGARLIGFDLSEFLDQPVKLSVQPLWDIVCEGEAIMQPLLVDQQAVYIFAASGEQGLLEAISQVSGRRLWAEALRLNSHQIAQPLFVAGFILLVTLDGEVSVVDAATGKLRHTLTLGWKLEPQVPPFALDDRALFVDVDGHVFEIAMEQNGPVVNHLYAHQARIASLAASNEFIALGHMAGLTLLDARGQLLWSNDSIESISGAPIVVGHSVFALDDTGNGLLFDVLRANPTLRRKLLAGWVGTPPLMTQAKIVAVSGDGKVTAIDWQ